MFSKSKAGAVLLMGAFLPLLLCTLPTCTFASACAQQDQPGKQTEFDTRLSPQERVYGLARIWSEVKYNYPMWHRLRRLDWDAEFRERIPLVMADQSDWEYYRRLEGFVSVVRDLHVSVYPPRELRQRHSASPRVQLWRIDNEFVVIAYAEDTDPQGRLSLGDVVTAVGGVPVQEYAEKRVMPYIASSSRHGLALTTAMRLLRGENGSTVLVKLQKTNGTEYECRFRRGSSGKVPWVHYRPLFATELIESRKVAPGIGYIRIRSFGPGQVVGRFKDALISVGDINNLIIDLRVNQGGNSGNGDRITQHLIEKEMPGMMERRAIYSATLRSWGRGDRGSGISWEEHHTPEALAPSPLEPRFHGKLALLTSAATGSASEDFIGPLAASGRALVIGQPTAGSTGNPLRFDLPGGGSFRVCTRYMLLPDGTEFIGEGIAPDIAVAPTAADVAAGRDPVLERAVAELTQ